MKFRHFLPASQNHRFLGCLRNGHPRLGSPQACIRQYGCLLWWLALNDVVLSVGFHNRLYASLSNRQPASASRRSLQLQLKTVCNLQMIDFCRWASRTRTCYNGFRDRCVTNYTIAHPCGDCGSRTRDLLIANQMFYQLN